MARARAGGFRQPIAVEPMRSPGSPKPAMIVVKDFTGLYTNYDAADVQVGAAQQQKNVPCERVGYLAVRGGFVRVLFRS